jgi:hypothetical protein
MLKTFFISTMFMFSTFSIGNATEVPVLSKPAPVIDKPTPSEILKIDTGDYYVIEFNKSNGMLITIAARCLLQNCQYNLELSNLQEFLVVSSEPGDSSLSKSASLTFMWNPIALTNAITTLDVEAIVYTTNFNPNFAFKKTFPFSLLINLFSYYGSVVQADPSYALRWGVCVVFYYLLFCLQRMSLPMKILAGM